VETILRNFISKLTTGAVADNEAESEKALHMAAALLLVEVGQADFKWDDAEISVAIRRLADRFSLPVSEAEILFEEARKQSCAEVSLHPTLRAINDSCDKQQKRRILEDCWRVAFADGKIDRYEEHHIRRIAELLYLPHSDFIRAKLRAESETERLTGAFLHPPK
jgi:uncharacterized tellurite resistance protein B-like protein